MKIKSLVLFAVLVIVLSAGVTAGRRHQSLKRTSALSIDGIYKFAGNLNGKIPIFVWFVVKDSVVKGEVTYLKTAKRTPINVIGQITKDNGLSLFEFEKSGNITGIYRGAFNAKLLKGSWFAPQSRKELSYTLAVKDTMIASKDMDFTPVSIEGEYKYAYGKNGASGGIDIKKINANTYAFDASCVTSPPAYNLADVDSTAIEIVSNSVIYKVPDSDCRFKLRFFKNFMVVDQLEPISGNCGFGNNASIDGVFLKTSNVAHLEVEK